METDQTATAATCSNHCIAAAANSVVGLISLHFKAMQLLGNCSELMEIANQLKLKVSIKDEIVYVKIIQAAQERQLDSPLSLLIDRIIHLHVKFPQDPSDGRNVLTIQLVIASRLFPGHYTELGESTIHLHQIAYESPFSAIATLSNDDTNEAIGTVKMDCCLNYGIFGYGKSLQLHHSYKDKEESLKWTTFPRVLRLPEHMAIQENDSMDVAAVTRGPQEKSYFNSCLPKPGSLVYRKMTRLTNWILQCRATLDRSKKLQFLEQLVESDYVQESISLEEPGIIARQTAT